MHLPVSLFIGLRYSQSRKGNAFISFITLFSVAGILLGVMALTIVSSVMNGFEAELKRRILGVVPHLIVEAPQGDTRWQQRLQQQAKVLDITPFLQTEALVQAPRQLTAVMLQGLTPEQLPQFLRQSLALGDWQTLSEQRYSIMLGRGLAEQLDVHLGQQIRVLLAQGGSHTPLGWMPRQRLFTVAGIIDTGSEVDSVIAITAQEDLMRLLPVAERTPSWRVSLLEPFQAPLLAEQLSADTQIGSVQDWRQSHGKLFAAVAMEKAMMWLMLLLIVAVAAFNIVSALVMMVTEKQAEVAILKTQGMTDRALFFVFAIQGLFNGLLGAVLGVIAGVLVSWQLNALLDLFNFQVAGGIQLPVLMDASQIATIFISAIGLTLLAVLYPAWRAVKINPAEVLRDE
ncbi:lipoprotein-releasing ABC transporter permease subunit [Alishewanella sp. 16-MA]|uniref:Lipoprotein-releasing ABC transporter permease subunit n=1 Tax=Alishewanella maricola TaxID=2795740 RepID=A0ABS8C0U9_9ALTE|nr:MULTISPECIES: lipoprotein-releasing ABC transporter permease subunit [Alishewanella]MDP4944902.1 lipoprotein-releasing ABC transporter permease subunit [Alishewanella sp.]MDP5205996.1 lipoprotein-releasing ABC transporter permease subunit [Alishewanella sp. SMS9]MCB5225934.1 lipoprotein-releasing ABC transporter permease subunit [Alishewanella maricola]MDP5186745.1 lipoprotein-releasing ABC transporter permease subunit [Alishewanella sp.]MDP5460264.1 lipoprotein-releasing ABC transporter pe